SAVTFLRATEEIDAAADGRIVRFLSPYRECFEGATGEVGRAGVNHGIVIGERHSAEEFRIIVAIERAPAAVAVLHGEDPFSGPLAGQSHAALLTIKLAKRDHDHRGIVDVGIELVVIFEKPTGGRTRGIFGPIAAAGDLLIEEPVDGSIRGGRESLAD